MTEPPIEPLTASLAGEGVVFLPGSEVLSRLPTDANAAVQHWADLPLDGYMPAGAAYRRRRYGRLSAVPLAAGGYEISPLPAAPFRQPTEVLPLYAGRARTFEPLTAAFLAEEWLDALVRLDLVVISAAAGASGDQPRAYTVGLHQIRVSADLGCDVLPAPEGRHRDGHAYVAMHMIVRLAVAGGESVLYRPGSATPYTRHELIKPFDSLIVDDRRVEHEVTAIRGLRPGAVRDMLLVDFDTMTEDDEPDWER